MTLIPGQSHHPTPDGGPTFEIVRRGYDREQVDARVRELTGRLAAAEKARADADQRIRTVDEELRAVRARSESDKPMSQDSFGFRAEKILRMAEHEAADVRTRAAQEATSVVEKARADAERHRHEIEQTLIARSAELDQEAAQRTVAIQEREQQAQATLADARDESARIGDEARAGAEKLLADAQARAEQLQKRTDHECGRKREAAEQELRRLGSLHDGVRGEIGRLHSLLGAEIAGAAPAPPQQAPAARSVVAPRTETREPAHTSR
ncbi:MAG: hypothetical protein ACT4RN_01900 [Pseudonocardia sp.]